MEYVCYVLYSKKYATIYIGYTTNLINRYLSHNKLGTKGYTFRYRPWEVIHVEFFTAKGEAMKREKQLKSSRGRNWIHSTLID